MVIPFIIFAVYVSKNEGRRYVDDIGVVVQQEEKDSIHVDWSHFSFSISCWIDGWIQIQFNRTDQEGKDAAIELIE
jgi:hypothetical protein